MLRVLRKHLVLYAVSVCLLATVFLFNIFGVQSQEWFNNFQKDSNALIVHKLACQQELGQDVFGGMLVKGREGADFSVNEKVPICQRGNAIAYVSQFGLQGKVAQFGYSLMHAMTGLSLRHYLVLAQFIAALCTAAVLSLFVVWVAERFGKFSAVTVLVLLSMSVWIVAYARNLYWATPLLFAPFIFTLYYYAKPEKRQAYCIFIGGLFVLFFLRFLNGFEFAPTIILASVAAIAFLMYERTTSLKQLAKEAAVIGAVGAAAFAGALAVNFYQVYHYVGNIADTKAAILERALIRTTEGEQYESYVYSGLDYTLAPIYDGISNYIDLDESSKRPSVLLTNGLWLLNYALLSVVNLPIQLKEPLYTLISSFAALGTLAFLAIRNLIRRAAKAQVQSYRALERAMYIGLIASLSWLVLGRSHSFVHAHLNGIMYYLPFMLLAYIAFGLWLEKYLPLALAWLRNPKPKARS